MKSEKTDRRVQYTKMVLREALTELLSEKPVSRITIKELCERADINRATFYAHYNDVLDLLRHIQNEVVDNINSYLDEFSFEQGPTNSIGMMTKIFEYIGQNANLCRVLLSPNGDTGFQNKVIEIVRRRTIASWEMQSSVDAKTGDYIYTFAATGSLGLINMWLDGEADMTATQLAEFVTKLTTNGFSAYMD